VSVALQVFIANRVLLIIISLLSGRLFYDVAGQVRGLLDLWHRWDVLWYIRVADHGYVWYPPPVQSDLAFFPLYPLSMHLLSSVTPLSTYVAGLLVTNMSFAAVLYLFHRLLLHDFDPDVAERTVYYLGLFPTALFFFTVYSEALFLLCCVGCVYGLRLRRWWIAGLCGMAATLTRQLGLLLVVPFAIEVLAYWRQQQPNRRDRRSPLLALALIPTGLLAFMAYLQIKFGDALLFVRAQVAWRRTLAPPWQGPLQDASHAIYLPGHFSEHTRGALEVLSLLDLTFLALFVVLIALGAGRLPRSYTAYSCAVMLVILINPAYGHGQPLALLSVPRFELTLFPPFIVLGLLGRSRAMDRFLLTLCVGLLALFTIVFVRGRWIA
jgi:Gpi18-like mannosyltransferase